MAVPLLDLHRQYAPISDEIKSAFSAIMEHNGFILGPEVKKLEKQIAEYVGTKHAIAVASGTDALLLALHSIDIQPGDEVITTPFTFFATAGVITRLGAIPVFVDIDPVTYNINPYLIETAITQKTKAILPVHLYGQCADMDPILDIAKKHNLKVVEDAAQGIGARYKDRTAGSMGDFGCFSFYPSKNLGAAGDAGMITTNDDRLDGICRDLRVHGANPKYFHRMVGYNSRMDSIQGAILLIKLKHLNSWHEARREKSHKYNEMFALPEITTPKEMEYNYQIYHQYTIRVPKRDELREYLKSKSIGCEVYYPLPLHRQKCYEYLGYGESSLSESEKASKEVISIPVFPELTDSEQAEVVETIEGFYK